MGEDRKRTSPEALLVLGRIGRHLDICHGYKDRQTQMSDTMRPLAQMTIRLQEGGKISVIKKRLLLLQMSSRRSKIVTSTQIWERNLGEMGYVPICLEVEEACGVAQPCPLL